METTVIAIISLCISLFTAWFTIFHRGTVKCTRPAFIAFRYDFLKNKQPQAKIFMRAMLYSTGKRGIVVENLFLRVHEGKRIEEFSFWGYGDKDLVRGSGLFIGEAGQVTNHHFNPINCEEFFIFSPGSYHIELVAKVVGRKQSIKLSQMCLDLPSGLLSNNLPSQHKAVFFNWSPEQKEYVASLEMDSYFPS